MYLNIILVTYQIILTMINYTCLLLYLYIINRILLYIILININVYYHCFYNVFRCIFPKDNQQNVKMFTFRQWCRCEEVMGYFTF